MNQQFDCYFVSSLKKVVQNSFPIRSKLDVFQLSIQASNCLIFLGFNIMFSNFPTSLRSNQFFESWTFMNFAIKIIVNAETINNQSITWQVEVIDKWLMPHLCIERYEPQLRQQDLQKM
ncbi:unnamed protein product (macronuclear) [Paramecium tetraurelia]|uniref:Uncharacterized protein n=1 Tax=Paramecium tetraurelia TaxID=5888 RepID=A0DHW2_PARTE|nr:uncharacterized protein GSPATT00039505001 [Paramecium tetraurelia]CAK82629.1 unnamed protein product [Paramecium tetraurelia]|eukprot:XP_001450026.1 hypothetical protein (macronuclear) [Paramecium tetraurelia strain d4-2]